MHRTCIVHSRNDGVGHTAWAPEGRKARSLAGPKGPKLEVGAQRAPKLLVCYISENRGFKDIKYDILKCVVWNGHKMEKRVFSPHLQTCLISNIKYLISLIHTVSIIHIPFIISLAILSQRLCNTVIHQCVCILYVHCSTNIFNISQKVFSIMLYLVKYTLCCMYHDIGLSCTILL